MNVETLVERVRTHFPDVPIHAVTPIAEGWDNFLLDIDDTFIFRFPRRPVVKAQLQKEVALLPALAEVLTVPVPQFDFVWTGDEVSLWPFVGYRKIPGISLAGSHLKSVQAESIGKQLAQFLSELHQFPVGYAVKLGVPEAGAAEWRTEYRQFYDRVRERILPYFNPSEQTQIATLWQKFLQDDMNFLFSPALIHRDLTGDHILFDPCSEVITGIIDWGDASIGDPAFDFAGLVLDYGYAFAEQVGEWYYGVVDDRFPQRAVFYSRLAPFHTVEFGLATRDETHIDQGLRRIRSDFASVADHQ